MNANIEIIPAILVNSQEEFERQLKLVENEVTTVQIDILDGSVYDRTSWFDAEAVGKIKTPVEFELHLMVENPLPIIDTWAKYVPGTTRAIIHAELDRPLGTIIEWIHQNDKLEAGMIGYVQSDTPKSWAEKAQKKFDKEPKLVRACSDGSWTSITIIGELSHCFRSKHHRITKKRPITLYHVFLIFC